MARDEARRRRDALVLCVSFGSALTAGANILALCALPDTTTATVVSSSATIVGVLQTTIFAAAIPSGRRGHPKRLQVWGLAALAATCGTIAGSAPVLFAALALAL